MPQDPDVRFLNDDCSGTHFEHFINHVRTANPEEPWRCLCTALDPGITAKPENKNTAAAFLKSAFRENADETIAFWLDSGRLFTFFRGPVRAVIRDYEAFLDFISHGRRPDYHFFWELQDFRGYFDQLLAQALKDDISSEKPEAPDSRAGAFFISADLERQRRSRYKPLLLIVEDDRVTRHLLQAAMEKYCDIAVAWTMEQARIFYQTALPNMVFLDIQLPDGNGQDLADLFCRHDRDSFVVMVSGALDHKKIDHCLKLGVKGCVAKPAHEKQLLEFVDQYHKYKQRKTALG